jgi:hypothetical protein
VKIVAMIHGAEDFLGDDGKFLLQMLPVTPGGKFGELVGRTRDHCVLRSYRPLRIECGEGCERNAHEQYK